MKNSSVKIDQYEIRRYGEPFIVAEAGVNHNGELDKAFEMIEVAKKAGSNAVKFQTFCAEEFCIDKEQTYTYLSQGKEVTESMLEMFKRFEFTQDEWRQIKNHCDACEIMFLSTAQNRSDLNFLMKLDMPAIKVGSDDFTNVVLLKDYASTGLPIIVSCGMADLAEIHQALTAIGTLDGYPTVLLLCTSQYPTPNTDVHLLKLKTLAAAYPDLALGFSDHTLGPLASSVAVGLGACCFEKHFTLDNSLPGPDHWFSENPDGLKTWVLSIRSAYTMLGSDIVKPTDTEIENRTTMRRSIFALQDIKRGERFTEDNIGLRRPGGGLSPVMFEDALNYCSGSDLKKGRMLKLTDFQNCLSD